MFTPDEQKLYLSVCKTRRKAMLLQAKMDKKLATLQETQNEHKNAINSLWEETLNLTQDSYVTLNDYRGQRELINHTTSLKTKAAAREVRIKLRYDKVVKRREAAEEAIRRVKAHMTPGKVYNFERHRSKA